MTKSRTPKDLRIQIAISFRWVTVVTAALVVCGSARVRAEEARHECPVIIEQVNLNYSHQGNPSVPRLQVRFANASMTQTEEVSFRLQLLDSGGYPHDYPGDLNSRSGLEPGKRKTSTWTLQPESVDIHRAGEVVILERVSFAGGTSWADDGSASCKLTVDFHAQ